MKKYQKLCAEKMKVIDRGEKVTLNEVKPVEQITKNRQILTLISHVQKKVPPSYTLQEDPLSEKILLNKRKITLRRESPTTN